MKIHANNEPVGPLLQCVSATEGIARFVVVLLEYNGGNRATAG